MRLLNQAEDHQVSSLVEALVILPIIGFILGVIMANAWWTYWDRRIKQLVYLEELENRLRSLEGKPPKERL